MPSTLKIVKPVDVLVQAGIVLYGVAQLHATHNTFGHVWLMMLVVLGCWQMAGLLLHFFSGMVEWKRPRKVYLACWGGAMLLTLIFALASVFYIGAPFLLLMVFLGLPMLFVVYWGQCLVETVRLLLIRRRRPLELIR